MTEGNGAGYCDGHDESNHDGGGDWHNDHAHDSRNDTRTQSHTIYDDCDGDGGDYDDDAKYDDDDSGCESTLEMKWLQHDDLARFYSLSEHATHNSNSTCWRWAQ